MDLSSLDPRAWTITGLCGPTIIGAALLLPVWKGRWQASVILSRDVGRAAMLWIHRQVKGQLDWLQYDPDYRRIECSVLAGFIPGERWAQMLGFQYEGTMVGYDPWGRAHYLYARTRP